uniref:Uncharacterized protein n=1 Tax=Setaria viridis TaxID=4556 RepID=A0A4U6UE07_SETVI|nr:hypothetical protein SEVIR_6G036900v2 [Setaria viridis]
MAAEPASVHARCGHVDRSSSGSARDRADSDDDGSGGGGDVVVEAAWHGGSDRRSGGRWQRGVRVYMAAARDPRVTCELVIRELLAEVYGYAWMCGVMGIYVGRWKAEDEDQGHIWNNLM